MKAALTERGLSPFLPFLLGCAGLFCTLDTIATEMSDHADVADAVVLGEEDLADRAEILRNRYRRMTPGDGPLVQDVGVWPAAWEEFSPVWNGAAAERDLGTWTVPMAAEKDGADTVIRDGDGVELWRGQTDFSKDGTESVVLTGALVAEDDWALYRAARDEIERRTAASKMSDGGGMRGTNGPCTNGLHFVLAEGNFATNPPELRVGIVWTNSAMVDVFAYGPLHTSETHVVTYTNDENEVVTWTNTTWHSVEPTLTGYDNAWEWLGTVAVSNTGTNVFVDNSFPTNRGIVRYYAAAEAVDSDEDGLNDGMEAFVWHTDPLIADTDGDGLADGVEIAAGTNPHEADTDGDGWGDGMETAVGFSPTNAVDVPRVAIQAVRYKGSTDDTGKQWVELFSTSARNVNLGGFRLEVGRNGAWSNTVEFAPGTVLESSRYLLIGEPDVSNADIQAALAIPDAWTNDPTTGVRLRWGGATNGAVADVVFIGNGPFNSAGLETAGWLSTTSVWNYVGKVLERCVPGLDTDMDDDWHWVYVRDGHNYASGIIDSDQDGLTDAQEWNGTLSQTGASTNPMNPDSDGDGYGDYAECVTYHTDPTTWASDGDIWPWMPPNTPVPDWPGSDAWELANGHNPTDADENTNGIPDTWEWMVGLDNLLGGADSDGDGISDWDEMQQNSNPLDSGDIGARPYVVLYEASRPGWENGVATNDIGLFGEVRVRFLGAHDGQGVLVKVREGYYREPFTLQWKGAKPVATFEGETPSVWYSSACLAGNSMLVVKDAGKHPEYVNTLGGEYTITNFTATIVPDLDRNRQIDDEDRHRAWRGEPLRMWVNDDNDNGPTADSGNDNPGRGRYADATADLVVDGACDLLDFFPVWVDASEVLANVQGNTSCRLRHSASALNAIYTDLPNTSASDFLTNQASIYGPGLDVCPQAAPAFQVLGEGVGITPLFSGRISAGKGVLMLEGRSPSSSPLVFEVLLNGEPVFATELPLDVRSVTEMYNWIDLRSGTPPSISFDTVLPNVLFIHGANVDVLQEGAWASEIYKRLVRSGASISFWPVSWESDIGQSWNYHENASNAFKVASWLGPVLSGGQGRKVVLAHSLGTVVAAAALHDYGGQADKLLMFNSAIPSEAFDPVFFNTATNNHLVHDAWVEYTNSCWTACWHELFPAGDARHNLTWRGRFSGITPICENFYSSGDEVLELYEDAHNPAWYNGLSPSGNWGERYSWHKQEIWKGRRSLIDLSIFGPSDWSGWGFKKSGIFNEWSVAEANAVTDPHVFATNTVFNPTPESITNATATRLETDEHLALGIPALSPAAGRTNLSQIDIPSHNMNEYVDPDEWPVVGRNPELQGKWLHSDLKSVAFLFTHALFETIASEGGLNP